MGLIWVFASDASGKFELKFVTLDKGFSDLDAFRGDAFLYDAIFWVTTSLSNTSFRDDDSLVGAMFTPLITARNPQVHLAS